MFPSVTSPSSHSRGIVIEKVCRPLFPERDARVRFTKKVYGVLSGQLLVTALVTWYLQGNEEACSYLLSESGLWVVVVAFVSSLSSAIALLFRQPFILSLALLAVFTGGESLLVGVIASQYTAQSVLLALGSTLTAVEYDLTLYGSSLLSALIIFVSTLFASFCFHIPLSNAAVGGIGAVLFSIFLIYDTQRIFNKRMLREDEYIRGAIELYLDIINMFVNVL